MISDGGGVEKAARGDMKSTRETRTCVAHYYDLCINTLLVSGPSIGVHSWIFGHHLQRARGEDGGEEGGSRDGEGKGKEKRGRERL